MCVTELLAKVHDLAVQIQNGLPHPSAPLLPSGPMAKARPLDLCMPSQSQCLESLSAYKITQDGKLSLLRDYGRHVEELQRVYEEEYTNTVACLQQHGRLEGTFLDAFRASLQRRFPIHCQRIWATNLEVLSPDSQQKASDEHRQHEKPDLDKGNRGHDLDAVRILEQAFQHTPNITQAEKYRLAEVTGLQPKQVTIWFQNRRNRKGRKGAKAAKNSHARATAQPQSPNDFASPPRDFTLNEKKRKSYGALGVASSSSSDSDSDEGFGSPKKPRLPRAHSGLSDASTSSSAHSASFTPWSSPSSRSTSSSSVSSSPSHCFDSPGKAHNVFRLLNPLKYDAHAKQDMPAVTMSTPSFVPYQRIEDRSPFSSDAANGGIYGGLQKVEFAGETMQPGIDFGGLQIASDAMSKNLCESVQKVLEMTNFSSFVDRSASGSSWGSMLQSATDDDGWVDEDKPSTNATPSPISVSNNVHTQQQDAAVLSQSTHGAMQFSNGVAISAPIPHAAATAAPWAAQADATSNGDMSNDSALSNSNNDPIDLHHFFESAAQAPAPPSYVPYQQTSPQQPIATAHSTPVANPPCLDFEVDMADIEDYLSSFVQPAVPAPSPDAEVGVQMAVQQPPEFYLNFDLSPDMFRVA